MVTALNQSNTYVLNCEWDTDRENGIHTLLSLALCNHNRDYYGYVTTKPSEVKCDWVAANVVPKLGILDAIEDFSHPNLEELRLSLKKFLEDLPGIDEGELTLITDHPKKIELFTSLLDTDDGEYWLSDKPKLRYSFLLINWNELKARSEHFRTHLVNGGNQYHAHEDASTLYEALLEFK